MKRILVIVAHPDDEVLGMGGTIVKYASSGSTVAVLIVTDGSTSQYQEDPKLLEIIEEKKAETQKAASILGVSKVYYGGLPDMKLDTVDHIAINRVIEDVVLDFEPDIVFTHFNGDVNKDHQIVFQSTLVACRPIPGQNIKEVYSFSVPSSTEWNSQNNTTVFCPNMFVDIDGDFAKRKYMAMECYSKELREYPHPRSIEALQIIDRSVGLEVGLKCAESFAVHRILR